MAPEQIRAEAVDGRTDVYAVGSMLYEMVTGRLPFEGPTLMAILSKHLTETAEPPSKRRPDLRIPPPIDQVVLETLATEPSARTPSMERLGERVAEVATQLGAVVAFGGGVGPSTAQVGPGGAAPITGQGAGPGSGVGPASGPGRPPTFPPPMTPGRVMRPPGVPHTYPPGAMQAPPEAIIAMTPGTPPSPATPVPLSPPTPPPPGPSYPSPYPSPSAVSPYAPPGYMPPGYVAPGAPHAAPLPSGTPPPPSHVPTPAPAPVVAKRRGGNKALILTLGLIAMAGAGVAVFLVVRGGSKTAASGSGSGSSAAAAAAATGPDPWAAQGVDAGFTVSVTQEGTIDPWKDGTVVTTKLGSTLTLPEGMVPGRIPVPDGAFYFVGNYQGAPVRVLLLEAPDDAQHRGYEALAKGLTKTSKMVRTSTQYVAGQAMDTVIMTDTDIDEVTPLEAEILFYSDGNRVVALIVGTSPEEFEDFSTIRMQFFTRRFQP
jgi:hypothetical protein